MDAKPIDGARCIEQMVYSLSGVEDPIALLRHSLEQLHRDLGAAWSFVAGRGGGILGDLQVARGCPDPANVLASLPLRADAPQGGLDLCTGERAGALVLWLPQHTQVVMAFGPASVLDAPEARATLQGAGRYVLGRLRDTLELERARLANRALECRISDLSLLFKGLDVTLSSVELTKVLRAFMTCVTSGEAIGFNRAFLLLLDEEQRVLRGTVAVGPTSGDEARSIWQRLERERTSLEEVLRRAVQDPDVEPAPGSLADRIRSFCLPLDRSASILTHAVLTSTPYNIHIYRGEAPEPFADAFGAREFVVIPILGRERTLGIIVADNLYSGEPLETERVYLLSGLANHVGVVIENALMFEDVSRRYAELREVQSINRAMLSSVNYVEVLRRIAQISASMLQATGSLLFIVREEPSQPHLEMQYNASGAELSEAVLQRCHQVAQESVQSEKGPTMVRLESQSGDVHTELVSAPMQIDNDIVGVLMTYRVADETGSAPFDRHSRRFLSIIADQGAIALQSGRRLQTIRDDQAQIENLNLLLYRNEKLAALGEASSKIAHEIRNPLTALGGFARRLSRSSSLGTDELDAAQVIVHETARLERILNDQLAFVRSARLKRSNASLNDVVDEALQLLRQQVTACDADIEIELDPELPQTALDADRMKQVLVNLLMNAIAVVGRRDRIRIATRVEEEAVVLEVANSGPPIPSQALAKLFVPFATTRQEGTGLGLAVVHQIVVEHGGRIEVLSEPPWGSIFRIRLKTAAAAPADGSAS
jgi:signal transduction histidine kinase